MEDLILASFSVVELGRVSATCRSFHAALRGRIAEEQKARCDLAAELFGRKRIMCIADIINSFLKRETTYMSLATPDKTHTCRISPNGVFQVEDCSDWVEVQGPYEAGKVFVDTWNFTGLERGLPSLMFVDVPTPNEGCVRLVGVRASNRVEIDVNARDDLEIRERVALVQGLLTWGFGPKHDARSHADVRISIEGVTRQRAEHQAPIAPLLPLLTTLHS